MVLNQLKKLLQKNEPKKTNIRIIVIKIIDNFLEQQDFKNIKNFLLDEKVHWFYRNCCVNVDDPPYFTFCFYNYDRIQSPAFELIQPILDKLNYSSIIQVRANLMLREENEKKTGWHTDYDYKNFKTAIYYIHESNGPTIVKDNKNVKIYPKENKILIMDGNTEHAAIIQTDKKRRVVLNINYYEK